ncbi:hypothetical protein BABINDRAFT_162381 [Babjeviella inositovora NRRL Y-12698]|uniref:EF-hand domain-containing protein n=1 Tax=Babjeviella inositovora NRRL Y-12698 TaxID=984486 RepID=A0A1E3QM30_9ASCO|nr:uncharacterized protein BABINDRAFT_162381 [Babjeviella inositovora NRRL Y-12698]ODQ78678.1 hypothetical protein BABINDRAFT_162381 [Babjeviella inositovora NRRL Y-12698]
MTWETWHMSSEHGISEFDHDSFFTLHDIEGNKAWEKRDILNLYGVLREEVVGNGDGMGSHDETEGISDKTREFVANSVLELLDTNKDGKVSLEEWRKFKEAGGYLRDYGVGVGHHLDFESEYEVHHWKEFHEKDDPDMKIQHAADVEHELLHHLHEIEHKDAEDLEAGKADLKAYQQYFKQEHIPKKYRV